MDKGARATQAFAVYCLAIAVYLSVGGYLQFRLELLGIAINEVVFLALPGLAFAKLGGLSLSKTFPFETPSLKDVLIVLLLTATVIAPVEVLLHFQGKIWPLPQGIETFYQELIRHRTLADSLIKFFVLALIPAICEELFFRGLLQSLLTPAFGALKAVLLVALFFGIAHANPWYFTYYFLLGVYLGWVRHWRNNLALCVLAHLANNVYSLYG